MNQNAPIGTGSMLHAPPEGLLHRLPQGRPLPEPVDPPTARRPCSRSEDELVPVKGVAVVDAYRWLGVLPPRTVRLRSSVLDRLRRADASLPVGFDLVVLDGWRSLAVQRQLLDHYRSESNLEGYVASVSPDAMRPPHTTGGAVDITLGYEGIPLALGTDFDDFTEAAHIMDFEGDDGVVRRLRRLLAGVLVDEGFVPYHLEWWHWSFGDDVWSCVVGGPGLFDIVEDLPA